jgi:hypothetical protein
MTIWSSQQSCEIVSQSNVIICNVKHLDEYSF